MDDCRFDQITRSMAEIRSRRAFVRALAGGALAGLAAVVGVGSAGAKQPPQECRNEGETCNAVKTCCENMHCCKGHCQEAPCNACPAGQKVCEGKCTHVKIDESNCGDCGIVCPAGYLCENGHCVCPPGRTECNGQCVSNRRFQRDPDNCGSCGHACDTYRGQVCHHGQCICPDGFGCSGSVTCSSKANTYTTVGMCCPNGMDEATSQVAECCTESALGAGDGFAHCCTPGVDCVVDQLGGGCPNGGRGVRSEPLVGCCEGTHLAACVPNIWNQYLCSDLGHYCDELNPCCNDNEAGADVACRGGVCVLTS
jgi:hypothetical protein